MGRRKTAAAPGLVAETLREDDRAPERSPATLHAVQKFLNWRWPGPGVHSVFYGKANDPDYASSMTHGVKTCPLMKADSTLNPPPKTLFQQKLIEKKEMIYASRIWAPLGKSHDQSEAFPADVNYNEITFGLRYKKGVSAGDLINPPKSLEEIEEESQKGHSNYVVTHNDYNVGELRDRKYDWTTIKKDRRFGIETPHSNEGKYVAQSLTWFPEIKMMENAKIISKRFDDFHERTDYQLGKVLNRTGRIYGDVTLTKNQDVRTLRQSAKILCDD